MNLTFHEIGPGGPRIGNLGFGTSGLGSMPGTYGYAVDEARAEQTLTRFFQGPANLLDTSRNYGMGESEARIGRWLRENGGWPQGFVLSTKLDRDMQTGRFDAGRAWRSLEESLQALGRDKVEILHLHDPEQAADPAEATRKGGALEALFEMKAQGLADRVGLAMGRLDLMRPILDDWPFDVLISHNRYTLLNRSADAMYTAARRAGVAIINAAPFAGGVLAKGPKAMPRITYQPADDSALAPVRRIEALCAAHGVPMGALALQFSMRDPRIACTLVGATRPQTIDRSLDWAAWPIPDALWQEIAALPYSADDPEAGRIYTPD